MCIEEIEDDNCGEMEFQPSLYISTSDLPSIISMNQILNALDYAYAYLWCVRICRPRRNYKKK